MLFKNVVGFAVIQEKTHFSAAILAAILKKIVEYFGQLNTLSNEPKCTQISNKIISCNYFPVKPYLSPSIIRSLFLSAICSVSLFELCY